MISRACRGRRHCLAWAVLVALPRRAGSGVQEPRMLKQVWQAPGGVRAGHTPPTQSRRHCLAWALMVVLPRRAGPGVQEPRMLEQVWQAPGCVRAWPHPPAPAARTRSAAAPEALSPAPGHRLTRARAAARARRLGPGHRPGVGCRARVHRGGEPAALARHAGHRQHAHDHRRPVCGVRGGLRLHVRAGHLALDAGRRRGARAGAGARAAGAAGVAAVRAAWHA